jgi:hypothetical protein
VVFNRALVPPRDKIVLPDTGGGFFHRVLVSGLSTTGSIPWDFGGG